MEVQNSKDHERIKLLVKVAKMYYEQGMIQSEIANEIGVSRPYISRLLDDAQMEGIVTTTVTDPLGKESIYALKLKQYYHLENVIILPKVTEQNPLWQAGDAAARYLRSIFQNGDIFALSWGKTTYECAKSFSYCYELKDFTVVQISGSVEYIDNNIYVSEIVRLFTEKTHGSGYTIPFPTILDHIETKKAIEREHTFQNGLQFAEKANIALLVPGRFSKENYLYTAGYFSENEYEQLKSLDAVGDICSHVINSKGEICDTNLDERTVALPLDKIKKINTRIGLAVGSEKAKVMLALLEGKIINTLIADVELIDEIRKLMPKVFE